MSVKILKELNRSEKKLLTYIYSRGNISRSELFLESKLKIANYYKSIDSLIRKNLVISSAIPASDGTRKIGRPSDMLFINRDLGYFYCIILRQNSYILSLTDFDGNTLTSKTFPYTHSLTLQDFLESVKNTYYSYINEWKTTPAHIFGIGLACGLFIDYSSIKLWDGLDIVALLKSVFDKPIFYETIANSMVFGLYTRKYAPEHSNMSFFLLNDGIGLGTIISGKVQHLSGSKLVTIEHWIINPNGRQCSCGENGCVLTSVGVDNIVKNTVAQINLGTHSILSNKSPDITFADICEAAENNDPLCYMMIEEAASVFFTAIKNYIKLIYPSLIVLGGVLIENSPLFYKLFSEKMHKYDTSIQLDTTQDYIQAANAGIVAKAVIDTLKY